MEVASKLIERIFNLMKDAGITATKLSMATGISTTTFSQWKKGIQKPSTDAIIKLASYFNVSTDYLLTGKEFTPKTNSNDYSTE